MPDLVRHGSLFSGIGGFDLAAEWVGWENSFHCEWNEFGQRVLKHYWPKAVSYGDITKTDFSRWNGTVDVISGGFPCQPYSQAGKRLGKEDERHLWPEMLRAIREVSPRWVVGENVRGLVDWNGGLVFDEVQSDLEAQGYEVQPFLLPACAVNAPHRRDRIWFVAQNASSGGRSHRANEQKGVSIREQRDASAGGGERVCVSKGISASSTSGGGNQDNRQRKSKLFDQNGTGSNWADFPTESPICGGNDGIPRELDGMPFSVWRNKTLKAYGNAVVPQVVYQIFSAICAYEQG